MQIKVNEISELDYVNNGGKKNIIAQCIMMIITLLLVL